MKISYKIKAIKHWIKNILDALILLSYDRRQKLDKDMEREEDDGIASVSSKIHMLYFSRRKHYNMLFLSLKSLARLKSNKIGTVYLYIDKKDNLDSFQIKEIDQLGLKMIVKDREHIQSTGYGPKAIINELNIFKEIAAEIGQNDYIAKVDSDALFVSDNIFKEVSASTDMFIGNPYIGHKEFKYCQGGCYFLKKPILLKITNCPIYDIFLIAAEKYGERYLFKCSEDGVITVLVGKYTNKIKFIEFYLKRELINNVKKEDIKDSSVIHFEQQKNAMQNVAKELGI